MSMVNKNNKVLEQSLLYLLLYSIYKYIEYYIGELDIINISIVIIYISTKTNQCNILNNSINI
jgi:hypothetical protein